MINKKIIIIAVVLCVCCLFGFSFAENNFVTMASGGGTQNFNTSTLGQAIVFAQKTDDFIAKSGYASVLMTSKSGAITFTDQTEKRVFDSNVVPIKVEIKTSIGKIRKIVYKVGNGENTDFNKIEAVEYKEFEEKATVTFEKNIAFTEGKSKNQLWLWAQYKDDNDENKTADSFIIVSVNISDGKEDPNEVEIESPDPLTKLASTNPTIKTSKFSIDLTSVKVSLYKGNSTSGEQLYSIDISSTSNPNDMFDEENSCINYLNSNVLKAVGKKETLEPNKEYTLSFDFTNDIYSDITLTFKVLSGGVADILPYPSPFNPNRESVNIRYLLAEDSKVTIRLYDKAGKIVCKLIENEQRTAGTNEEQWNGRNYAGETLATGAYIVEIIADGVSLGENRRYTALAIVGK